ncbi:hypothetical protein HPP92_012017 [Vanilla planifolia]|uniref:Protein kinase domain-containing protein n=1 Tax=Vanilla planifolia TaxID=51239 RepID=A0A835QYR3_VANPL|nr:hypothetical protein HPP92_012017 [Vanilla planifolia]
MHARSWVRVAASGRVLRGGKPRCRQDRWKGFRGEDDRFEFRAAAGRRRAGKRDPHSPLDRFAHVVSYLGDDVTESGRRRNLHLEYLGGGTLAAAAFSAKLLERDVRVYARSITRALQYLHSSAGLVHGDVKGGTCSSAPNRGQEARRFRLSAENLCRCWDRRGGGNASVDGTGGCQRGGCHGGVRRVVLGMHGDRDGRRRSAAVGVNWGRTLTRQHRCFALDLPPPYRNSLPRCRKQPKISSTNAFKGPRQAVDLRATPASSFPHRTNGRDRPLRRGAFRIGRTWIPKLTTTTISNAGVAKMPRWHPRGGGFVYWHRILLFLGQLDS